MLSDKLLKQISGAYDLELVTRIDLSIEECTRKGIDKFNTLSGIESLVNLVELDISGHNISDLKPLNSLLKLQKLNISQNELTDVNGIQVLENLEHLQLQGNMLRSLAYLEDLTQISTLKHLYLQKDGIDNPLCGHPSYSTSMLRKFPNLTSLDGERLKLKVSAQKALLESMAVPKAAFEVPQSKPWLEHFDWEDGHNENNSNSSAGKSHENNMMNENFLEYVTKKETEKFKKSISECDDLNNDALQLLNNINIDNFLGKK